MESIDDIIERVKKDFNVTPKNPKSLDDMNREAYLGDPNCPICHGIGFVAGDYPIDDPRFGKMDVCSCRKAKLEEETRNQLIRESNLSGYADMSFETFNVEGRGQLRPDERLCLKLAFDHAQKFAKERKGWLLLTGNYGTGKTHLAAAISNAALADHIPNIFLPVPDLLDWIRASFSDSSGTYAERFDQIRNIPLLILDDLGTQSATPWAEEKLYQILNYRYVNRLPTVITTNCRLQDLDGRIASRLEDPSLVTRIVIQAPDYRKPMANTVESDDLSALHRLSNRTFENFDSRVGENLSEEASAQLNNAFNLAYNFAQHPTGWLVFSGPNGVGKTHLAAAIGNYRQHQMDHPLFVAVADLLDHLRATFSPVSTISYDIAFEKIRNAPLLILDHLDTANASPWAKEKLFQILDHRYLTPLPTVITTVLPIQDIDPNIRSRLVDFQVCQVAQMFQVPMYSRNPQVSILPERTRKGYPSRRGK